MKRLILPPAVAIALLTLSACSEAPAPEDASLSNAASRVELAGSPSSLGEPQEADAEPGQAGRLDRSAGTNAPAGVKEIEWDALIPDDYRPDKIMAEYNIDELSDDDPRALELLAELQELWDKAPVRDELDGVEIKLPGFVVPVEGDAKETTGFLLVPYYGACIHVPPPPANQTVYVLTEAGQGAAPGLFEVVWVTGTMSVKRIETDLAEAGYTLYASEVTPYE
jgi:hypothetical protein